MMNQKKMVVRKLKICKFSLVSKICYFFGSLSCVSCFLDGWRRNSWRCGAHIFAFQSWTDFRSLVWWLEVASLFWILNDLFWNLVILTGQGCQISTRPLNFEFETENRCPSKFVYWRLGRSDLFLNFSSADEPKQSKPKRQLASRGGVREWTQ